MNRRRIIGVDPGNGTLGLSVIDDNRIIGAFNANMDEFWSKITNFLIHPDVSVIIEDLAPYSLRLTPQVIDTAKLIGEVVFRLKQAVKANVELIPRSLVKKWVYESFPDVSVPLCQYKINRKLFDACDLTSRENVRVDDSGKAGRKPSFVYVDDKIVTEAMKEYWEIKKPQPGYGYDFGLKEHSWQALAVATYYLEKENADSISNPSPCQITQLPLFSD